MPKRSASTFGVAHRPSRRLAHIWLATLGTVTLVAGALAAPTIANATPQVQAESAPIVSSPTTTTAKSDLRGDTVTGSTHARSSVATPKPGEITIARLIVTSQSRPRLSVRSIGNKAGSRKITVVGGIRKLASARSSGRSTYGVTAVVIKPRIEGARKVSGAVQLDMAGRRLKVQSNRVHRNTFSNRVSGEMCRGVNPFGITNRRAKSRVEFSNKVLLGRQLTGFGNPGNLGTFSVLQACKGKTVQSFANAVKARRAAVTRETDFATTLRTSPTGRSFGSGQAVVLVSGFLSQTPFTSPGNVCSAPNMSAGGTWSAMQTALADAGFPVFTAPELSYTYGVPGAPVPVPVTPSTMGLGTCGPQLPASMTLDTAGDFDTNSSILAGFLNYLNTDYGISQVWLVGHSDGGLWSRGAMDYASFMPGISVESVTTIDTPWTGSFLANTASDQLTCSDLDIECNVLADVLNHFSSALANGDALDEMDATYMTGWNQRLAGVPGATPFYAASAIGLNDPTTFSLLSGGTGNQPFYNPNDIAVGIASQQAAGLLANGTIASLTCFATIPGLHTEVPSSLLTAGQDVDLINSYGSSATAVTVNPMTIANVTNVLNGAPPTGPCPSANYQQSGEYAPGQFGSWPDN